MKNKVLKIVMGIAVASVVALGLVFFSQSGNVSAASLDGYGKPGGRGAYTDGTGSTTATGYGQMSGYGQMGYGTMMTGVSTTPLSDDEKDALQKAILEEYGALNLYQSVIAQFGNVYPFSQIALSEQQHVNALVTQASKYGVEVPQNTGLQTTTTFASITDACKAGVDAEIADAALYDDLKSVTTHSDILRVFTTLQNASLNSHLPSFQACD